MKDKIKESILSLGADVCGIAHIDRFKEVPKEFSPTSLYGDCKSVIVFGVALPTGLIQIENALIYGHFNTLSCHVVDKITLFGAKMIEATFNCLAVPLPSDGPCEVWHEEKMEAHGLLSMKHAAVLAGIGILGKNSLLINPKFGNLLTLGAILTDLDLSSDELCSNICLNNCTRCIDNCPVDAIKEGEVNQKLCRVNTYKKDKRGLDIVACNTCRTVCPMKAGVKSL